MSILLDMRSNLANSLQLRVQLWRSAGPAGVAASVQAAAAEEAAAAAGPVQLQAGGLQQPPLLRQWRRGRRRVQFWRGIKLRGRIQLRRREQLQLWRRKQLQLRWRI